MSLWTEGLQGTQAACPGPSRPFSLLRSISYVHEAFLRRPFSPSDSKVDLSLVIASRLLGIWPQVPVLSSTCLGHPSVSPKAH